MSTQQNKVTKVLAQGEQHAVCKMEFPIMGGMYAVVETTTGKAKTGLCLDAAFELFKLCEQQAKINRKG